MTRQPKVLALFLLVLFIQSARADIFTYAFFRYPKEERSCHQQTSKIAELFEKGTLSKVVHIECSKETSMGYDFSIEYEAPQKLEFTTTDYSWPLYDNTGRYRQQSECLANLPNQVALFESATGLKPFISYCRSLELETGKNWEISITAVGKSEVQPHVGSYIFFHDPSFIDLESLKTGLKKVFDLRGGVLADVVVHFKSVMGTGGTSIHYFSPKRINFRMERLSLVPNRNECEKQLSEAKEFLKSEGGSLFALYCANSWHGNVDLHFGIADKASFTWQPSADTFGSFQECESQKANVLQHYSGSPAHPLLGGLCSRDYSTHRYQVIVFKKGAA